MVLVGLLLTSLFVAAFVGRRTNPFDPLAFTGTLVVLIVTSIAIIGVLSLHSHKEQVEHQVNDKVINLNNGIALQKESGEGLYITYSAAEFTTGCDSIKVNEISEKTYPYLLGIVVTTGTHYEVCLPDGNNPAFDRQSG